MQIPSRERLKGDWSAILFFSQNIKHNSCWYNSVAMWVVVKAGKIAVCQCNAVVSTAYESNQCVPGFILYMVSEITGYTSKNAVSRNKGV